MEIKTLKRYTERFKNKVLKELENGELSSYQQAMDKYKIGGAMTVRRWIKKAAQKDPGKAKLLYRIEVIDEVFS